MKNQSPRMNTLIIIAKKRYKQLFNAFANFVIPHPKGNFLITEIIRGVMAQEFERIIIIAEQKVIEHGVVVEEVSAEIFNEFNIEPDFYHAFCVTNYLTEIKNAIKQFKIEGSIMVLDCDFIFSLGNYSFPTTNALIVADVRKFPDISVSDNEFAIVANDTVTLCETHSVGTYAMIGFYIKDAAEFRQAHSKVYSWKNFNTAKVLNFISQSSKMDLLEVTRCFDISTHTKWKQYLSEFRTIFVTLDGILIKKKNRKLFNKWYDDETPIKPNVQLINGLYDCGLSYIIIVTNRPEREELFELLKEFGIKYHRVIGDLPDNKVMFLNCFDVDQQNPSVSAVNIPKNSDTLKWSVNPNE